LTDILAELVFSLQKDGLCKNPLMERNARAQLGDEK